MKMHFVGFAYHHLLSGKWQIISAWHDVIIGPTKNYHSRPECVALSWWPSIACDRKRTKGEQGTWTCRGFARINSCISFSTTKQARRGQGKEAWTYRCRRWSAIWTSGRSLWPFRLWDLTQRSLILALANDLVTETHRETANCPVSSREPLSSVARWITRCCSSDSLIRVANVIEINFTILSIVNLVIA